MQTFLPYPDFNLSASCLDNKRLNKQIIEALQIHTANAAFEHGIKAGWQNHPAVKMWRGFGSALLEYRHCCILSWRERGFLSHQDIQPVMDKIIYPPWFGDMNFHLSHQSNLVRKFPEHYKKYFRLVPDDLEYVWPVR